MSMTLSEQSNLKNQNHRNRKDNFLKKAFVTILYPTRYFESYYRSARFPKCLESTTTISFDCDYTEDIKALPKTLEILKNTGIKASFACIGKWIEKYPDEHASILQDGHEIINHTYSHPFNEELGTTRAFDDLDHEEKRVEISKCHEVCRTILKYEPTGFRVPHFARQKDDSIYEILSKLGYSHSSSKLASRTLTDGVPYVKEGIVEFPITICPKHPFQAFDTYHAFRHNLTKHSSHEEFLTAFEDLIRFGGRRGIFINVYFDPQDIVKMENFQDSLIRIKKLSTMMTYKELFSKSSGLIRDERLQIADHSATESAYSSSNEGIRYGHPRILLVCAPGGHFTEMMRLKSAFEPFRTSLMTYEEAFLKAPVSVSRTYQIENMIVENVSVNKTGLTFLYLLQFLILTVRGAKILLIERPDILISTGSEIAVPIYYMAKMLGKKILFIESICRVDDLSGTGRIIYPIADRFLVQWPNLTEKYNNAIFKGNVLQHVKVEGATQEPEKRQYIFVATGTAEFPRLIEKMDEIAGIIDDKVIMQMGRTKVKPKNSEYFTFVSNEKFTEYIKNAKLVVSHAGAGTLISAIHLGKPVIAVPRLREFGENVDNHQLQLSSYLEKVGLVKIAHSPEEILRLIQEIDNEISGGMKIIPADLNDNLLNYVRKLITEITERR